MNRKEEKVSLTVTINREQFEEIERAMRRVYFEYRPGERIPARERNQYVRRALLFASKAVNRDKNSNLEKLNLRDVNQSVLDGMTPKALNRLLLVLHYKLHPEDAALDGAGVRN